MLNSVGNSLIIILKPGIILRLIFR